ncbi:hypothetical protein PV328_001142 [Microctonus aethiopoides]|uniref:Uncharacterized protein n=1 Tax=Microctonus aethiopoides TaxID=144406 RepID=A0AA39FWY1_9HYME|nr:hypothetical protein PV328_001142 [Microctonus aethiopoides]
MGKKTQTEPRAEEQNNPDAPLPIETETASGPAHINEVELMRRRVAELARDLDPMHIITVLDARGLSSAGPNDTLTNRLVRVPQVTFADGHRLSSSPVLPNNRASSTRLMEPGNGQERNSPTPPRDPDQIPQPSAFGGSSWFKNTTFNVPGSR